MQRAELKPAYFWECPKCNQPHFERSAIVEFTPEEAAEWRLDHGVDPLQEGEFLTSPSMVGCDKCGRVFDTLLFGDDEQERSE